MQGYQRCLEIREKLAARPSDDARLQTDLALTLYKLSLISEPSIAKTLLTRALSIVEVLDGGSKLPDEQKAGRPRSVQRSRSCHDNIVHDAVGAQQIRTDEAMRKLEK